MNYKPFMLKNPILRFWKGKYSVYLIGKLPMMKTAVILFNGVKIITPIRTLWRKQKRS